ncbi:hypothetical protein KSP40_PGU001845 [Platanthera guangdongensis]|uniref:Uncharacterized protein n=1 Tax=Platanthera guangdongensis TaxID=2320717 RepID=A0ABR2LPJ1_9ASPA
MKPLIIYLAPQGLLFLTPERCLLRDPCAGDFFTVDVPGGAGRELVAAGALAVYVEDQHPGDGVSERPRGEWDADGVDVSGGATSRARDC